MNEWGKLGEVAYFPTRCIHFINVSNPKLGYILIFVYKKEFSQSSNLNDGSTSFWKVYACSAWDNHECKRVAWITITLGRNLLQKLFIHFSIISIPFFFFFFLIRKMFLFLEYTTSSTMISRKWMVSTSAN